MTTIRAAIAALLLGLLVSTLYVAAPAHADELDPCKSDPASADCAAVQYPECVGDVSRYRDALATMTARHEDVSTQLVAAKADLEVERSRVMVLRVKVGDQQTTIARLRAKLSASR